GSAPASSRAMRGAPTARSIPPRSTTSSSILREALRGRRALDSDAGRQQVQCCLREDPHVGHAIALTRLDRDDALHGAGYCDARMARRVAVTIARRARGSRLAQTPRGAEQLPHRARLEQRVGLAARPDARDLIIRDP